jgi:hypothetical protein
LAQSFEIWGTYALLVDWVAEGVGVAAGGVFVPVGVTVAEVGVTVAERVGDEVGVAVTPCAGVLVGSVGVGVEVACDGLADGEELPTVGEPTAFIVTTAGLVNSDDRCAPSIPSIKNFVGPPTGQGPASL